MRDGLIILVRRGENSDAALLPNIERSAARAFEELSGLGWTPGNFVISAEDHLISIARGTLWVTEVNGRIAGFLAANPAGNELHIDELNVHFDHQRSGIGRRLIAAALGHARRVSLAAITLTTFRDVPWNGPFYASMGFDFIGGAELGPRLQSILDKEAEHGLPREKRCAMRLKIGS